MVREYKIGVYLLRAADLFVTSYHRTLCTLSATVQSVHNLCTTQIAGGRVHIYNYDISMEEFYTTRIARVGTAEAVYIPRAILRQLGWGRGDRVVFTFAGDDQLIVKKLPDELLRKLKIGSVEDDLPVIDIK